MQTMPTQGGVLVGSCARVPSILDKVSEVPGVQGVMLTFDFLVGMEQFGTRVRSLTRRRNEVMRAA